MSLSVSLFELALELIRAHERGQLGEKTTVIPVLVENLSVALPVLRAVAEVLEGQLFDVSQSSLQVAVPGTKDAFRTAAVVASLAPPGRDRHIELVYSGDGTIDAAFADPPAGDPSAGERAVLGVARAIVHEGLDQHSFAVIAYEATPIDLSFQPAVWNLLVDQMTGMLQNSLRTLVVVAESPIDVGMYCQTGRGFRFAIDESRLLRRNGADDLTTAAVEIAHADRPVVFFLGAGFSASSHLPLGNSLRDGAIRRLLDIPETEPRTSEELAGRFFEVALNKGWLSPTEREMTKAAFVQQLTLEQVVHGEAQEFPELPTLGAFKALHDDKVGLPGQGVRDLCAILEKGVGRVILVEVNFDLLIETHVTVPIKVFASDKEFADAADYIRDYLAGEETAIPLLKVHGTISDPITCVIDADQTSGGLGPNKLAALAALLQPAAPHRLWVYVGASLRDRDLGPFLRGEDFRQGVDERWVSPYLPASVEELAISREHEWKITSRQTTRQRLITESSDAFFAALLSAWVS